MESANELCITVQELKRYSSYSVFDADGEAWQCKRSLDGGVSNGEIDAIYEQGRTAGAWGGKLLGAGGGGFMLFFAPPEAHPKLEEIFADRQLLKVKINAPGSQIIFS